MSFTMEKPTAGSFIAIACGGTGGHLFPGLAVAEILRESGCDIALLISPKEVDQEAVKALVGFEIITLPAVALQGGRFARFLGGAWKSYRLCRARFQKRRPAAVLAMGGFTSAPPILAGKRAGAVVFLHEANAIPGRANRWLAPWVDEVFVTFPEAAGRLSARRSTVAGMPVRPQFKPVDPAACRMALGLAPDKPVLLVTGGSQGASGINELVRHSVPALARRIPGLQFLHLSGAKDAEVLRAAYASEKCRARVLPFLTEMELALGAATLAVSRAGASSLAEMAAMRTPSILIPYPSAADNHQFHNARFLENLGAAIRVNQSDATPGSFVETAAGLLENEPARARMSAALELWNSGNAAVEIAGRILTALGLPGCGGQTGRDETTSPLRRPSDRRAADECVLTLRSVPR
jgi:UDP-N-acetylglucosamine--N-acetylmuramyl-(pentapeptide) pyrophosphoryl-undecaprenol N-acetylglucosamine transferase